MVWGQPILRRGYILAQAEGGLQFKSLEEGRKFNQSLINKHFVLNDQWGQAVQLIIYTTKNGNFEGSVSLVSLRGKEGSLQQAIL